MTPLRVVVLGASGRMGHAVRDAVCEQGDMTIVAALVSESSDCLGNNFTEAVQYSCRWPNDDADVVIDFSTPESLASWLPTMVENKVALVSGVTGFGQELERRLQSASEQIPVMVEPNMSVGVALLYSLARRATEAMPQARVEIVETHHIHKKDAPSGTALRLAEQLGLGT